MQGLFNVYGTLLCILSNYNIFKLVQPKQKRYYNSKSNNNNNDNDNDSNNNSNNDNDDKNNTTNSSNDKNKSPISTR